MYLLDTDILIWVLRGREEIVNKVSLLKDNNEMAISVISIAEIYKNIFPSELPATQSFLNAHTIISVDKEIAEIAGLYWQQYSKQIQKLSLMDCFIAATAKNNKATLMTLNIRHFPMSDISKEAPQLT